MLKAKNIFLFATVTIMGAIGIYAYRQRNNSITYIPGKTESNSQTKKNIRTYSEQDFIDTLPEIINVYGRDIAIWTEKLYRWETGHFKSRQFLNTGTPGMEVHGIAPTYGWAGWFFIEHPYYLPVGVYTDVEGGTGKTKKFIIMPSTKAAALFVADYIKRYGPGRWYSKNYADQQLYLQKLQSVIPRHVNNMRV